ncbi:MAG: ABC transporter permease, partial [Actinobacteria bacterium]|nr:ABC transporter permease [Actinomycetota bacterium]
MLHIALRGVRHNVGRYLATLVAIMTGVAFFAAAGAVSARVVSALEGDVDARYAGVDAAVVPEADASATAEPLVLDEATFDAFGQIDGVAAVAGEVTGPVAFQRGSSRPFGDGATGRLWITDDQLNPITISEGRAPAADDEVAIDAGTAERHDLGVGDEVTLLSVGGEIPVRVSAITAFGNSDALDNGGTVSLAPGLAFVALTGGRVEYQDAFLRVTGDPDAAVAELRDAVPSGFDVQSGDQFRADKRQEAGSFGRFLKTGLQAFALLALLVGGFVIYNTFSVTIAQRQRELAVLSAIGATPKQLKRSLRAEGLIIGLLGSTLGAAMGLGLAFLLVFVLGVAGMDLPGSGVGVEPGSLVQAVLLGTVITLGSVVIPVRRAAKIEPIEALRVADVQGRAISTSRKVVAIGMLAVGAAGLFVGSSPAAIGIGALLLVVGAIVAGPLVALGGARLLRPVMGRFGLEGRLALDNTVRSPKRTATTANALLIGVFLVTFVTVAGTSLKDFAVREIQQLESADFVVASSGGSLDDALLADLAGAKGVRAVTP